MLSRGNFIRLAEHFDPHFDPFWRVLRQVGIDAAVSTLDRRFDGGWHNTGDRPWDYAPLHAMKRRFEAEGLELVGIEDYLPMDKTRLGLPGRDDEIDAICTLIRNMGNLDISMLCYNWMACVSVVRTDVFRVGRGGARVTAFRMADMGHVQPTWANVVPAAQLWDAWEYFIGIAGAEAEKAGVRLALHPDDPPVPQLRMLDRIMNSLESYERAMSFRESEANAICFCQGNFTLFSDNVPSAIRHLGNRVAFVHFRDVAGTPGDFTETFHDEGMTDSLACMQAWQDIGFTGVVCTDHVPTLEVEAVGESKLARLHAIGYLQGLREAAANPPNATSTSRSDDDDTVAMADFVAGN